MRPHPRVSIAGTAARAIRNGPTTLVSMTSRHVSAGVSQKLVGFVMKSSLTYFIPRPALLTNMSSRPKRSSAVLLRLRTVRPSSGALVAQTAVIASTSADQALSDYLPLQRRRRAWARASLRNRHHGLINHDWKTRRNNLHSFCGDDLYGLGRRRDLADFSLFDRPSIDHFVARLRLKPPASILLLG